MPTEKKERIKVIGEKYVIKDDRNSRLICKLCVRGSGSYAKMFSLVRHIEAVHDNQLQEYECKDCKIVYKNVLAYNKHIQRRSATSERGCMTWQPPYEFSKK